MRVVHCIPGHSIPGRVRLRLSPESPKPNLDDVRQIDGVEKATFSNITKSLLIVYHDKMPLEDLLSGIEEKLPQLSWSTTTGQMRVVREEPRTQEATGAAAGAALPFLLSLIALGVVILIRIDFPIVPAFALVWWGFNRFTGRH